MCGVEQGVRRQDIDADRAELSVEAADIARQQLVQLRGYGRDAHRVSITRGDEVTAAR